MGGNRDDLAKKKKKKTKQESKRVRGGGEGASYEADIDPLQLRFAHSRIRPVFSGCGREVSSTLEEIRVGSLSVCELPIITVIEGPPMDVNSESRWYFTTNNRRGWVLKTAREQGLIGHVKVRVRVPRQHELGRYTLERCGTTTKFIRERRPCPEKLERENIDQTESIHTEGSVD